MDIWIKNNTNKKSFTYHNSDNTVHCRSDQIHTTRNLTFKNRKIIPRFISDHDRVTVKTPTKNTKPKKLFYYKNIIESNQDFFDKSIYLWLAFERHCFHGHA